MALVRLRRSFETHPPHEEPSPDERRLARSTLGADRTDKGSTTTNNAKIMVDNLSHNHFLINRKYIMASSVESVANMSSGRLIIAYVDPIRFGASSRPERAGCMHDITDHGKRARAHSYAVGSSPRLFFSLTKKSYKKLLYSVGWHIMYGTVKTQAGRRGITDCPETAKGTSWLEQASNTSLKNLYDVPVLCLYRIIQCIRKRKKRKEMYICGKYKMNHRFEISFSHNRHRDVVFEGTTGTDRSIGTVH